MKESHILSLLGSVAARQHPATTMAFVVILAISTKPAIVRLVGLAHFANIQPTVAMSWDSAMRKRASQHKAPVIAVTQILDLIVRTFAQTMARHSMLLSEKWLPATQV
jgi:hypothetical protein